MVADRVGFEPTEDMQHDLNQVSNEEEATKFIDLQILEFANKHRHLIHVYREYADNETNMSVLTWKREYAEYVEETIKKLPKPTSRKKKKERQLFQRYCLMIKSKCFTTE